MQRLSDSAYQVHSLHGGELRRLADMVAIQADQIEALSQELHSLKKLVRRGSGAAAVEAPTEQGAMGAKLARLARWAPAQLGSSHRHSRTNSTAEAGQDKSPTSGRMSQSSPKTGAPSDARERLRALKSLHDEGMLPLAVYEERARQIASEL
mmetsp:Transcript_16548/g.53116  ORF Transcript_16548/g.53116 Transcript_16548/m.53116 type:complete len:152 (-) Transcript_16548:106-561(-)